MAYILPTSDGHIRVIRISNSILTFKYSMTHFYILINVYNFYKFSKVYRYNIYIFDFLLLFICAIVILYRHFKNKSINLNNLDNPYR